MYDKYENGECTIDQIGGHVIRFIILTQPWTQRSYNESSSFRKLRNVAQMKNYPNTSLAAPGALANRLQRRTARKANEAFLDPPNQKSEITSL